MQITCTIYFSMEDVVFNKQYVLDVNNIDDVLGQTKDLITKLHSDKNIIQCAYSFNIERPVLDNTTPIEYVIYTEE